jgi:hypothetical protein
MACRQLVSEVIEPVTSVVTTLVPMSIRVLWGNVASAVNSASMLIAAKHPAAADTAERMACSVPRGAAQSPFDRSASTIFLIGLNGRAAADVSTDAPRLGRTRRRGAFALAGPGQETNGPVC